MPPATPPWPIAPAPGRRNGSRFPAASRVPASSAEPQPAPFRTRAAAPAVSWLYGGGTGRGGSCHAARGWRGRSRTSAPRKWPRSVSSEAEPGLQLYDASHERRGRYSEEGVIGMRAVVVEGERTQVELVKDVEEVRAQLEVRFLIDPGQVRMLGEVQAGLEEPRAPAGERTQVELVKDVEEVRAQLEVRFLIDPGQVRMLGEVQVGLEEPRAPEGVAADARRAAGLDIEVSRATLREVTTGHERSVRLAIAGASEILRGPNGPQRRPAGRLDRLPDHGRPWKAGVPGDDRRKFPSAQDFGQNTPLLPEGSGDIPDRRGGDLVAHVVIRGAPVQAVVLGPRLVGNETGSLKGRIVEAPGPAVIKDELEAMVHGAAERQDAGAIVGVVVRHGEIDRVERRVVGIEKVLIHQTDDVMALAAGVSEVGRKLPR